MRLVADEASVRYQGWPIKAKVIPTYQLTLTIPMPRSDDMNAEQETPNCAQRVSTRFVKLAKWGAVAIVGLLMVDGMPPLSQTVGAAEERPRLARGAQGRGQDEAWDVGIVVDDRKPRLRLSPLCQAVPNRLPPSLPPPSRPIKTTKLPSRHPPSGLRRTAICFTRS
ncbi:MAG: hypothetical protein R3B96_08925 [Pirellulaceae bacterium]